MGVCVGLGGHGSRVRGLGAGGGAKREKAGPRLGVGS